MPYRLQIPSGANLSLASPQVFHTTTTNTFEWYFDLSVPSGATEVTLFSPFAGTASEGIIYIRPDGVYLRRRTAPGSDVYLAATLPFDGTRFNFKAVGRASNDYELYVNGVSVATSTVDQSGADRLLRYMAYSGNATGFTLYQATFAATEGGSILYDWDASGISTGTVLFDAVGSNDATQASGTWPADDSEWDFYSAGGGLTIQPTAIASAESVPSPVVTNLLQVIEANSIPTAETFNNPVVVLGATVLLPNNIPSEEAFGTAVIQNLLQEILPTGIASAEDFGTPTVLGGDSIVIPVTNRQTVQRIAEYLKGLGFTGNNNDIVMAWLRSEGYNDAYNDNFSLYLEEVEGLTGSFTDKFGNWRKQ